MRILFAIAAIAGCAPYDPSLPPIPFYCGSTDPKCPDGYTCMPVAGGGSAVCATAPGPGSGSGTCTMAHSGVLATWDFTGAPGTQTSTAGTANAPGVTAGAISRAPGLVASGGAGSINASNWSSGPEIDTTKYYTLAITPAAGCTLALSSIAIDVTSSTTGPAAAAVATSANAFSSTTSISTTAASMSTLSVTDANNSVELRIYGFSASATTGTMRVQNMLMVTGTLQ